MRQINEMQPLLTNQTANLPVAMSHYQQPSVPSIWGNGTSVTNPNSTTVFSAFNPSTNMYDVKVGDQVVKSFYGQSLADKYIQKNGANLLKDIAPLGDVTQGSKSVTVYKTFNKKTKMYDVKVGDQVVKSFHGKKAADKFINIKGDDILKKMAPLGDVTKGVNGKNITTECHFPTPKDPSKIQLGTANATPSSGMTWKKYAEQHGTTYTPPTSGVGEADRRAAAIIKGNQEKQRVKDILGQKTEFTPEKLDKWAGLGPNKELDDMNAFYRDLEQRSDYKRAIGKHLKKPTEFSPENLDKWNGWNKDNPILDGMNDNYKFLQERSDYKRRLGEHLKKPTEFSPENLDKWAGLGPNKELDNMNDYYRALEGQSKSGFNWKKAGKWAAIGLGVAAVVGLAVWGIKKYNESKEAKLEDLEPSPQPKPKQSVEPDPQPVVPTPEPNPAPIPEPCPTPVPVPEPVKPEPVKPNLPVDPDGTYTTKKGDTFWGIAKKHLADKYQDQPEKFANLTEKQQNVLIKKECERIMKANGYWYDDNHNLPNPMLYTNKKLVIEANMNIAA